MKPRHMGDLLSINICAALLIFSITFLPAGYLRIILGFPFMLFFPGYALIAALFPGRGALEVIERVAFGCGLSLAMLILVGLILDKTAWGIGLYPTVICLGILTFSHSLIAWHRRKLVPEEERFTVSINPSLPTWIRQSPVEKMLFGTFIITIVGVIGAGSYILTMPRANEGSTHFYVLGPEGSAENYPRELMVGEEGIVIVGIANNEGKTLSYRVEVRINEAINSEISPVVVDYQNSWEEEVSFVPTEIGKNQKVEFLLYKLGRGEIYRSLYLWIDVVGHYK